MFRPFSAEKWSFKWLDAITKQDFLTKKLCYAICVQESRKLRLWKKISENKVSCLLLIQLRYVFYREVNFCDFWRQNTRDFVNQAENLFVWSWFDESFAFMLSIHSVEITAFFFHSDFTWNQSCRVEYRISKFAILFLWIFVSVWGYISHLVPMKCGIRSWNFHSVESNGRKSKISNGKTASKMNNWWKLIGYQSSIDKSLKV